MGQIISWFRGPRDEPALRDVSVEESQSGATPKPAAPVAHFQQLQKSPSGSNMASKTTTSGSDVTATGSASKGGAKLDPKVSAKTTAATTAVKVEPAKMTKPSIATTTTTTTTTTTAKASAAKAPAQIQVEVPQKAPESKKPTPAPAPDPLDALASFLPTEASKRPEPKYTGPEVKENTTAEQGVHVGEREDTLPPGYRLQDMGPVPADAKPAEVPKSMSTDEALDVLSFGFDSETPQTLSSASKAQSSFAPAPPKTLSSASKAQSSFAPAPPKKSKAVAPPADKKPKLDPNTADLDALSALEDLLPSAEPPKPEAPLRPEDLVPEATVTEEEGVKVGEREDTLPPEYRLTPEERSSRSRPPPQASLDTEDALDLLSGDFSSCTAPAQAGVDAALDSLSGDFIAPSAAASVQSSGCPPEDPLAADADFALDVLSDSLKDIAPTPRPEPPMPKNIITEAELEQERLIKMGERDDTLPPEYRPTGAELQKMLAEKADVPKDKMMDDNTALDILSGDFSAPVASSPVAPAPVAPAPVAPAPVASASVASTNTKKPMPGKVLDSLYDTLLPESVESKRTDKTKKSPAEGAVELPHPSSNLVATSTKKS